VYPILIRETSASHLGDIVIHLTLNSGLVAGASRVEKQMLPSDEAGTILDVGDARTRDRPVGEKGLDGC